jgi:hypothetical protein
MKQPTLQEQYNLLKEGKGQKDVFMKSVRGQFPNLFNNLTTFDTAVKVLKQKQIISESIGGVATGGTNPFINWKKFLAEEAKAEEKKPTKEVTDMETAGFDYKDEKNIDNLYGEAFLQGYYTEMKDPANEDKDVTELKEIVAKNLAKDPLYYTTEAQFGVKGIGYTDEAPGLKASKSDQMVPVKEEMMIKLTDLINEAIGGYIDVRPTMHEENAAEKVSHYRGAEKDDAAHIDALEKDMKDDKKAASKAKKKVKKESIDSKLSEIETAGKATTLEAQIEAVDEAIEAKNQRITMVSEDENLSELVDKSKLKEMQKEVKLLEKKKADMEKIYEKLTGKSYVKTEIVDEADDSLDY